MKNKRKVLVSELLKQWGQEGFLGHVDRVQKFYSQQREIMLKAAETHLTGKNYHIPA